MSIVSAAALIAVLSVFGASILCLVCSTLSSRAFWFLTIPTLAPFIFAYSFYWSPAWLGCRDQSEFAAWAVIFIVPWFIAGTIPAHIAAQLIRKHLEKQSAASGNSQPVQPQFVFSKATIFSAGLAVFVIILVTVQANHAYLSKRSCKYSFEYPEHQGAIAELSELRGSGTIYLVQLGEHTFSYSLEDFAGWMHTKYGLDVRILPPMNIDQGAWNPKRRQYIAELLYQQIKITHPDLAADGRAYLIGFTDADMYSIYHAWASDFTERDSTRSAVISTFGMGDNGAERARDPHGSDNRMQARLRRILLKDVAVLYWHLSVNEDPTSLLHNTLDPDLPTESIYESDLNPAASPAGQQVDEPCLFLSHTAKDGIAPLPGPLVRSCVEVKSPYEDSSVEIFEVDLRLGLFIDKHTDVYLPDVIPIQFQRVTRDGWPGPHPFGRSGTDNYDVFLGQSGADMNLVTVDGGRQVFSRSPHWLPVLSLVKFVDPEDDVIEWQSFPSGHLSLKDVGGGISTYLPCPTSETYCLIDGYQDGLGRALKMDRDDHRNLVTVASPGGNWIHLRHGFQGRIEQILDSRGKNIRYEYDQQGDLTKVVYPSGEIYLYSYDQTHHILSFSFAADAQLTPSVILKNEYRNGLIVKQTFAGNSVFEYEYEVDDHGNINKAIVRGPAHRSFTIDVTEDSSVIHETVPLTSK